MYGNESDPAKIYQYGARRPDTGLAEVEAQMHLAARYKNALIANERQRREWIAAALNEYHPAIATIQVEYDAALAALATLQGAIAARNAVAKRKTGTRDDRERVAAQRETIRSAAMRLRAAKDAAYSTPDDVREARAELSAAKRRLKLRGRPFAEHPDGAAALAAVARAESRWHAADAFAAARAEIDRQAETARKQLRASSGLYWGSYLAVEQDLSAIRSGAPPEFVRWDGIARDNRTLIPGAGRIAIQLQGGLAWNECLECTDSRLRIEDVTRGPARADTRYVRIWLRVGSSGRDPVWATVPVKLHRQPPADSRVQWVYLHRERTGLREEWRISFVCAREEGWDQPDAATSDTVAIEVGWRRVDAGLRVAVWLGSDGASGELVIPNDRLDRWQFAEELHGMCGQQFDAARDALAITIGHLGARPEWFTAASDRLVQWRSPIRLAALYHEWTARRFEGDEDAYAIVRDWFAAPGRWDRWRDRFQELADSRTHLADWRDNYYRVFVAGLRRRYRTAMLEATNWREIQVRPGPEEESDAAQRHWARAASVGRLTTLCREGFAAHVDVEPAHTTRTCAACQHVATRQLTEQYHVCEGCGAEWDVDENAARNLLAGLDNEELLENPTARDA